MNYELEKQVQNFNDWLETADLGPLADLREFVAMEALDNASDAPVNEVFNVAKATVATYLDQIDEYGPYFDYYRH